MNQRERISEIINRIYYTNEVRPVQGNRFILASNEIFSSIGITDIDLIYKLAKVMEKNSGWELEESDLDIIYKEYVTLTHEYLAYTDI